MENEKKINNSLVDLIKFIAAILVIFSHSFSLSNSSQDYLSIWINDASFGSLAVSIFFCFSGYYITKSILKDSNKFIIKRLKRLLPELIIVVLFTIFIIGPIFTNLSIKKYFLSSGTYIYLFNIFMIPVHNLPGVFINNIHLRTVNGVLWTLSVEFACYLFIFLIYKLKLLKKEKYHYVIIASIIISLLSYLILRKLNVTLLISMIRPFVIFLISSLLYFYNSKISKKIIIIDILLSIIFLLFRNYILYDIFLIVLLPQILCYVAENIKINNRYISYLGKISYAMYLIGFIIQQSVISIFGGVMNPFLNFVISIPLTIIFGIIIYEISNKIMKEVKL